MELTALPFPSSWVCIGEKRQAMPDIDALKQLNHEVMASGWRPAVDDNKVFARHYFAPQPGIWVDTEHSEACAPEVPARNQVQNLNNVPTAMT